MEQLNFNKLLDREQLSNNIKTFLIDFENIDPFIEILCKLI